MPIRSPQAQLKQCMWTAKWLLDIFLHFAAIGFLRRPNGLHVSPWQERMRNKPDPRLHVGKKDNVICHLLPTLNSSIFRLLSSVLSRLLLYIYTFVLKENRTVPEWSVFTKHELQRNSVQNKIAAKPQQNTREAWGGVFGFFKISLNTSSFWTKTSSYPIRDHYYHYCVGVLITTAPIGIFISGVLYCGWFFKPFASLSLVCAAESFM